MIELCAKASSYRRYLIDSTGKNSNIPRKSNIVSKQIANISNLLITLFFTICLLISFGPSHFLKQAFVRFFIEAFFFYNGFSCIRIFIPFLFSENFVIIQKKGKQNNPLKRPFFRLRLCFLFHRGNQTRV